METIYGDFVLCDKNGGEVKLEAKAEKLIITMTKDSCCSRKKEQRHEALFRDVIGIRLLKDTSDDSGNAQGFVNAAAEVEGRAVAGGNGGKTRFALTFKKTKEAKRSGLTSHSTRTLVLRCLSTNLGQEVLEAATSAANGSNAPSENGKSETLTPAQLWVQAIAVARMRNSGIAHVTEDGGGHGQRLLVLVNPKSGVGSAAKIYKSVLEPILREAQIPHDMVQTTRGNYGRDLVVAEDVHRWSGIVIISGDGLLFEVLQVNS